MLLVVLLLQKLGENRLPHWMATFPKEPAYLETADKMENNFELTQMNWECSVFESCWYF